jgi:hypothetical protein
MRWETTCNGLGWVSSRQCALVVADTSFGSSFCPLGVEAPIDHERRFGQAFPSFATGQPAGGKNFAQNFAQAQYAQFDRECVI